MGIFVVDIACIINKNKTIQIVRKRTTCVQYRYYISGCKTWDNEFHRYSPIHGGRIVYRASGHGGVCDTGYRLSGIGHHRTSLPHLCRHELQTGRGRVGSIYTNYIKVLVQSCITRWKRDILKYHVHALMYVHGCFFMVKPQYKWINFSILLF